MANSDHTKWGKEFQEQVQAWFINEYGPGFELEKEIEIGADNKLKKPHKFDIVNADLKIAIECKRYTWTAGNNVPSAKMAFLNEATFYLSKLKEDYTKYIVMLDTYNEKHECTLAKHYWKTNRHLLGDIKVAKYNPENPNSFEVIDEDSI